jgi:glycosyltransferase involved in cell wall biosynthesis/ADP-heptose:LPS heptosyltransferase
MPLADNSHIQQPESGGSPVKKKLLVVELWGLGDLVIATPFLKAAARRFDVTLLAKPFANDLQRRFWPEIKVVSFVAPWTAFRRKYRLHAWPWRELFGLRKLAQEGFGVGLSARWDPRDHVLLRLARARLRYGFPRLGSAVFLTHSLPRPAPAEHRFENWRVLARALEIDLPRQDEVPPAAPGRCGPVVVHTGAGQAVRVWPLERYQWLIRRLREERYAVRVASDPDQLGWWQKAGETSLVTPRNVSELLEVIGDAGALIGNDSGPCHLAAFCGVPTLTLFGPQLPEWFAPMNPRAEWIEGAACPYKPCWDDCRFDFPKCLWNLPETTVWSRAQDFLDRYQDTIARMPAPAAPLLVSGYRTPKPRRFIQVFCRYMMRGGEEKAVFQIEGQLTQAGHEVVNFIRASEEWNQPRAPLLLNQIRLTWRNAPVLNELRELQHRVRADAWIFHNLVPVVSLGAYRLAREMGVPVIRWLHDYRPLSPSGTLRAGGRMLDPEDRWLAWKEVLHGTWHGRLATAALILAYARVRARGDFNCVKAWIPVSEEMRQIFARSRVVPGPFFCLRHAWNIAPPLDLELDEGHFLVLTRMVEEKGVRFLVDLWRRPEFRMIPLVMAGEGPLADELIGKTPPNIRWAGFVRGAEKRRLLAGCRAVLFPSLWAEPLGLVVYEAYEQGKPVLASALGGLKEIVFDGQSGRLLPAGNPEAWARAILELHAQPAAARQMGLRGMQWLNDEVSPAIWNRKFDEILARVLAPQPAPARPRRRA